MRRSTAVAGGRPAVQVPSAERLLHHRGQGLCQGQQFHPFCDYLERSEVGRRGAARHLADHLRRSNDTKYTEQSERLVLIAAVRRVRKPGCKFDEMLVLERPQRGLKVDAAADAGGQRRVVLRRSSAERRGARVHRALRGRWIVEASELSGMKTADVEHLKAMLSRLGTIAREWHGADC